MEAWSYIGITSCSLPTRSSPSQSVFLKTQRCSTNLSNKSALYHVDRLPGTTSYAFMWSIPNMIPLPPSEIHRIWRALKPFSFEATYGGFSGQDVRGIDVKQRVLESMKIQVRRQGHEDHEIFKEVCE